jgi:DNA-binding transcriptional LysR family regulator
VNTRFLETFIVLAKLRNFRATAHAMHATPAAISLRLKSLEDELGTKLIERSTKGVRLTANGEYLLGHARSVVDAACRMRAAAGKDGVIRGRLRLGVIESVVHSWLSYCVKQLTAEYPELTTELTVDMSSVLHQRLLANELDLIIRVEGIDNAKILSDAIAIYPVRWIAKADLMSTRRTGLVKRVLQRPILTFARGTAPHRAIEEITANLASQADVPLSQVRITGSPSVAAIVQLVNDGYGIAAIPSLFVINQLTSGSLVEVPLQPTPPAIVVSMCRHSEAAISVHAAARTVRIACANYCRQFDGQLIEALC